jgi:predicted transcriptional regulator
MNEDQVARWQAKSPEQRFLNMLGDEFNQPSRIAQAILADATSCLMGTKENLKPGQMRVILAARGAGHGKAVREMATKEVIWTVDAGEEDYEIGQKRGRRMMRQQRILRLLDEALAQGAVATQEDLARVLQVTVRTIKRDCKVLRENGTYLPTRGNLQGIGRGQTHKAQIVKCWLEGQTYDQVARQTHHSVTSVQRYIQAFVRVIQLRERGLSSEEIALLLQVGQPLVEEYLAIYEVHDNPFARQRLAEQLQRLKKRSRRVKKGVA